MWSTFSTKIAFVAWIAEVHVDERHSAVASSWENQETAMTRRAVAPASPPTGDRSDNEKARV